MKKTIYTIAMIFIGTGISMANQSISDNSEKGKKDSSKIAEDAKETSFIANYSDDSHQLIVNVAGTEDPYASVSVTNQRGTAILCSFVQEKSGEMTFDLSSLEKGTYNVMLITDQEIRIKRIQVN